MGVCVEQWRASIGSWCHGRGLQVKCTYRTSLSSGCESCGGAMLRLLVLLLPLLLAIGCVEKNPGPVTDTSPQHGQEGYCSSSAVQRISTFPKRSGTNSDKGPSFEINSAILLALHYVRCCKNICMAANVDGIGAFDDLVINLQCNEGLFSTVFLQLKIRGSPLMTNLFSNPIHKSKLGLHKYYLSYRKIKIMFTNKTSIDGKLKPLFNSTFDDCKFIILTNSKFKPEFENERKSNISQSQLIGSGYIFSFDPLVDKDIYINVWNDLLDCKKCLENLKKELLGNGGKEKLVLSKWIKELSDKYKSVKAIMEDLLPHLNKYASGKDKSVERLQDVITKEMSYLGDEDDLIEFMSRIEIHCDAPSAKLSSNLAQNEIKYFLDLSASHAKITYYYLKELMHEWWNTNQYLYKENIECSLQNALSKVSSMAIEKILQILYKDITFKIDILDNLWACLSTSRCLIIKSKCRMFTASKLLCTLERKNAEYIVMKIEDVLDIKEIHKVWKKMLVLTDAISSNTKVLTNVESVCESLKTTLLENKELCLVILSKEGDELSTIMKKKLHNECKQITDTCTLTQLDEETQEILLSKKVIFQGYAVVLKELLGNSEDLKEKIEGENIEKLISENSLVTIGEALDDYSSFFIPRKLTRSIILSPSVFFTFLNETAFVLSGITKEELSKLIPDKRISTCKDLKNEEIPQSYDSHIIVMHSDKPKNTFKKLCKLYENIHWIIRVDGYLIWQQSQGDIEVIFPHILPIKLPYEVKTAMDVPDRLVLVTGPPGMGKTTLLRCLAQESKKKFPSMWIIHISLTEWAVHVSQLKNEIKGFSSLLQILEHFAGVAEGTSLEKAMLSYSLEVTGNIVILFDGFDEISDHSEIFSNFLMTLKSTSLKKIWLTSRPVSQNLILKEFTSMPFSIEPLTKTDQKLYLLEIWKPKFHNMNNINSFVKKVMKDINRSLAKRGKEFMGIPLHTMMIAEAFKKYISSPKFKIPLNIDLHYLYKEFIEKKYNVFFREKICCSDKSLIQSTKTDLEKSHMKLAVLQLTKIFPNIDLGTFDCSDIDSNKENLLTEVGIIDFFFNHVPHFIHRNLMEYYIALWMAENYRQVEACRTLLMSFSFHEQFSFIVKMFNAILCEGSDIHMAVLNDDVETVERMIFTDTCVNSLDKGGRTPLHLAAAQGSSLMSKILINMKADLNIIDNVSRWRPLQYAKIGLLKRKVFFQGHRIELRTLLIRNNLGYCIMEVMEDIDFSKYNVPEDVLHWALTRETIRIGGKVEKESNNNIYHGRFSFLIKQFYRDVFDQHEPRMIFGITCEQIEDVLSILPQGEKIILFGEEYINCNKPYKKAVQSTISTQNDTEESIRTSNDENKILIPGDCRFVVMSNHRASMEYRNICQLFENAHRFHIPSRDFILHIASKGSIELLNVCKTSPLNIQQNLIPDKLILINAQAGVGKTEYLSRRAFELKQIDSAIWIFQLKLGECIEWLEGVQHQNIDLNQAIQFLLRSGSKTPKLPRRNEMLEEYVLCLMLTNGIVEVLVDEIEMLNSSCKTKAISLFKILRDTIACRICIAVEPFMKKELEEQFSCLAYTLRPHSDHEIEKRSRISISGLLHSFSSNILLFTNMLLYVLMRNFIRIHIHMEEIQLNPLSLFVEYIDCRKTVKAERNCMIWASYHLFSLLKIKGLNIKQSCRIHIEKSYIPHPSFIQYFAAKWLSENYKKHGRFLEHILFHQRCKLMRIIFDYILADRSEIHIAALEGDLPRLQELLQNGGNVNLEDKGGRTPLHLAVASNVSEYVEYECERAEFGVTNRMPPISFVTPKRKNVVELLLSKGSDLNRKDNVLNWTPAFYAVKNKAWVCLDALLEKCKETELNIKPDEVYCPAIEACILSCVHVLQHILDRNIINISTHYFNNRKDTLLHIMVYYQNTNFLKHFISRVSNIDVINENGSTPLHEAVKENLLDIVDILLSKKANPNAADITGRTPLHFVSSRDILHRLVIAGGSAMIGDMKGYTPLLAIVSNSCLTSEVKLQIVKTLLKAGCDVNARTETGHTALHLEVMNRNPDIKMVELLLHKGANVNLSCENGDTPFHEVIIPCHTNIVKLFLAAQGDFLKENIIGIKPLHLILFMQKFRKICASFFTNFGRKVVVSTSDNNEIHISARTSFRNNLSIGMMKMVNIPSSGMTIMPHFDDITKEVIRKAIRSGINISAEMEKINDHIFSIYVECDSTVGVTSIVQSNLPKHSRIFFRKMAVGDC